MGYKLGGLGAMYRVHVVYPTHHSATTASLISGAYISLLFVSMHGMDLRRLSACRVSGLIFLHVHAAL